MYSASMLVMGRRHPTLKWSKSKDSNVFRVPEISGLTKHPMGSQERFHSMEAPVIVHYSHH